MLQIPIYEYWYLICLPRTKPVIVDDYPFISPLNKGAIAFGDTAIQIVTETHGTQLQARQALTQLRGRKVALAHHSIGTSISLEFTPLYRTRRTLTQTGRFIGGRNTGCDSIFLYCLDWTLRFGPLSMNAMDEERSWRLRKWLKRLEGLTLIDANFDARGTLDLVFDKGARLTALRSSDDLDDDAYWDIGRHPHPVAWNDYIGPQNHTRYRGVD